MILLDCKEIQEVLDAQDGDHYCDCEDIAKAQAKKFAEFLLASNNLLTKEGRAVILEIIQQLGGTCL